MVYRWNPGLKSALMETLHKGLHFQGTVSCLFFMSLFGLNLGETGSNVNFFAYRLNGQSSNHSSSASLKDS